MKVQIRLERYHGGWQWRVSGRDVITEMPFGGHFRTNRVGSGLWQYVKSTTQTFDDGSPSWEWRQIKTEAEFWLNVGHKPTYDRIRYMLANGKL